METKSITQVSCGCVHTVALSSSGEAFTWGSNSDAQLGIATVDNCSSVPRFNITKLLWFSLENGLMEYVVLSDLSKVYAHILLFKSVVEIYIR